MVGTQEMEDDQHKWIRIKYLNLGARAWMQFICACMLPTSHTTNVNPVRAYLIFAIMECLISDVGQEISKRFRGMGTRSTRNFFPKSNYPVAPAYRLQIATMKMWNVQLPIVNKVLQVIMTQYKAALIIVQSKVRGAQGADEGQNFQEDRPNGPLLVPPPRPAINSIFYLPLNSDT
ncbi:hypothetical protein ACH5RR_015642 [Cinchona calisaya]|uniref:Uncharacterized protein n=1 Tax=Cinchona calisaya TaxID=153742 RepID=A0ABD2ZU38_9GENT